MAYYSHSQIEAFLQCKLKYKFKYIDRIKVDVPTTIELFMGDLVHQALKELYVGVKAKKIPDVDVVVTIFEQLWKKQWKDEILVVAGKNKEDFFLMGRVFIRDFYTMYYPFDQFEIIGIETNDRHVLIDGNQYSVRIDKLCKDASGTYYVCDYKTNNKMKTQSEVDSDRQLAMYSLWVRKKYADCKDVKLVWYFLAHKQKITSQRTEQELVELEKDTVRIIKEIETCKDFTPTVTRLCDWCVYKSMCPAWNPAKREEKKKNTVQISLSVFN